MNFNLVIDAKPVKVIVARAEPMHGDEFRIEITCSFGKNNFKTSHGVQKSGIVSGRVSLEPTFWRIWQKQPAPYDGENIEPPTGINPETPVSVGSTVWYAGRGAPSLDAGKPGDCYLDTGSGDTYKVTRGIIHKLAEDAAIAFAKSLDVDIQFAALGLPIITPAI